MGWIRMLTGERMRREQENAGATSASRMPAGGEETGVEGGGRGDGGRIGEAERRSPNSAPPPNAERNAAGAVAACRAFRR
uniref:Uncharacterized protein n=1 Tax=Oryza glumipatula TaxID=40148 RepID=A0A0E0AG63_9ORYZ